MQQLLSNASHPSTKIINNRPGTVSDGIVLLHDLPHGPTKSFDGVLKHPAYNNNLIHDIFTYVDR
jgi:hypothetical protein